MRILPSTKWNQGQGWEISKSWMVKGPTCQNFMEIRRKQRRKIGAHVREEGWEKWGK